MGKPERIAIAQSCAACSPRHRLSQFVITSDIILTDNTSALLVAFDWRALIALEPILCLAQDSRVTRGATFLMTIPQYRTATEGPRPWFSTLSSFPTTQRTSSRQHNYKDWVKREHGLTGRSPYRWRLEEHITMSYNGSLSREIQLGDGSS